MGVPHREQSVHNGRKALLSEVRMHEAVASPLAAWESFYVIVGSSAAALTGLQFVVMALIADAPRRHARGDRRLRNTDDRPLLRGPAGLGPLSAPWPSLGRAVLALRRPVLGIGYTSSSRGARAARRATSPCSRTGSGTWAPLRRARLLAVGASALLRDHVARALHDRGHEPAAPLRGIHNAWDTVTYIAVERPFRDGPP
jgi:hypothetical protein